MRLLTQNLYVFVFSLVSLGSAVWVASGPDRAAEIVRYMVEDAAELQQATSRSYQEIRNFPIASAMDDAAAVAVVVVRLPTLLFEQLADRLGEVNKKISKRAGSVRPVVPEKAGPSSPRTARL